MEWKNAKVPSLSALQEIISTIHANLRFLISLSTLILCTIHIIQSPPALRRHSGRQMHTQKKNQQQAIRYKELND